MASDGGLQTLRFIQLGSNSWESSGKKRRKSSFERGKKISFFKATAAEGDFPILG